VCVGCVSDADDRVCVFLQAFPARDAEDVECGGSESSDGLLSGAAGTHILRAGEPQSKSLSHTHTHTRSNTLQLSALP